MLPSLLKSGICQLAGITRRGIPVVYFTSTSSMKYSLPNDGNKFTEDLVTVLNYFHESSIKIHGTEQLCVVVNKRNLDLKVFEWIVQVLNHFGSLNNNVIQQVYIYDTSKPPTPHKLRIPGLGIRKKKPNTLLLHSAKFPHQIFHDYSELCKFIDPEQMVTDMHGRLTVKLRSWLYIWNIVEKLCSFCKSVELCTPMFLQRINERTAALFSKSEKERDAYHAATKKWFLKKKEEMLLNKAISQCQLLVEIFMNPYMDPFFSEMEGRPVFKYARRVTLDKQQQLSTVQRQIDAAWNKLEEGVKGSDKTDLLWWKTPPCDDDNQHCDVISSPRSLKELSCEVALKEKFGLNTKYLLSLDFFQLFSHIFQWYHHILCSHVYYNDNSKLLVRNRETVQLTRDEIQSLQSMLRYVDDFTVRTQARLLSHRCFILLKFCKEEVSLDEMRNIESWKLKLLEH